jgi:hypothetical protein
MTPITRGMPEDRNARDPGKRFFEKLQPFAGELIGKDDEPREVPARAREVRNEAGLHGIAVGDKDDRNRAGRPLHHTSNGATRENNIHVETHQLGS